MADSFYAHGHPEEECQQRLTGALLDFTRAPGGRMSAGERSRQMGEERARTYAEIVEFMAAVPKFTTKNPMDETRGFYDYIQSCEDGRYRKADPCRRNERKGIGLRVPGEHMQGERLQDGDVRIAASCDDEGAFPGRWQCDPGGDIRGGFRVALR